MKNFFEKPTEKIFNLKNLPTEVLLYRVMPKFLLEIVRKYFRLEIEGLEHIPKRGAALLIPNHSGYSGFDAILLSHEISRKCHRIPRVLTHSLWFIHKSLSLPAHKLGFVEATTKNGMELLKKNNLVVLFPEGEQGNFKPTSKRYRLQEFKRGFVRMALQSQCPIIPVVIIGAEETHINLSQLKFTKFLRGTILPLPLNLLPLPAKWKIKILPPVYLPYKQSAASNRELVHEISKEIREKIQEAINGELAKRNSIYID